MTIDELAIKVTDGAHHSPKEAPESKFLMASSKDMAENDFDLSGVKRISEDDYLKLVKGNCKPLKDDLLIIKDGNSYLKRAFVIEKERDLVILSSIAIIRPNKNLIYPKFFKYLLKADFVRTYMKNFVSGSAIPRIILDDFKKMKVEVPPLPLQTRIADLLSAYDELIELNNRRIALLEQTAEQLYKEWFVRLRFPGYEQTKVRKGVPEGWEVKPFGDFLTLKRGYDLPNSKMQEGQYPVIASTSIKGFHNVFKVAPPVVVTGRSGSLGQVQYINYPAWPLNTTLYVKDFHGNKERFAFFFLKNMHLGTYNSGAGVPTLNRNHINTLKINVPPIDLQKRFEEHASSFFDQIDILQTQNQTLRRTRDLLLPRLISGQLSVAEAETALNA